MSTALEPSVPTADPVPVGLSAVVDRTPATRDRVIDLVRAVCIMAVALGHWLVVVPSLEGGRFDGVNALTDVPLMQALTWLFQVMPLFFVAGGVANAASWRSAKQRGEAYGDWLAGRLRRLLAPTTVFLAVWVGLGAVVRAAGIDAEQVHLVAWLVVVPLWFLSVYVVIVALAPAMLRAHLRWGGAALAPLAALAVVDDVLRLTGTLPGAGYLNFLWVFLFCQQLGFFWLSGQIDSRRTWLAPALLAGGVAGLGLLTLVGPYPVSLVGVPGDEVQNNAPPTVTFLALALAQVGAVAWAAPQLRRWLAGRRTWLGVVAVNAHALTLHLWHFTALVVVALVLLPTGLFDVPESAGSAGWWAVRVLWLVPLAGVLLGLVAILGRHERRALLAPRALPAARPSSENLTPSPAMSAFRSLLAVLLLSVGFCVITLGGLSRPEHPLGLPLVAIALYGTGLACVRSVPGFSLAPRAEGAPGGRRVGVRPGAGLRSAAARGRRA